MAFMLRVSVSYFDHPELPLSGDPWFYYWQSFFSVHGRPYIDPFNLIFANKAVPASDHPPLTTFLGAVCDFYGLSTYFEHQVIWSIIGTGTVLLIGVLTKNIAGERAGELACILACIYPGLWINDTLIESETIVQFLVVLILWLAYRHWRNPSYWSSVFLGGVIGLDLMARSEDVLLLVIVVVPLTLAARRSESSARGPLLGSVSWGHFLSKPKSVGVVDRIAAAWKAATTWGSTIAFSGRGDLLPRSIRIKMFAALSGTTILICAPWVVHNLTTFKRTEIISTQLGRTLIGANCPGAYSGSLEGYWDYQCQLSNPPPPGDQSISDAYYRDQAIHYALNHKSRWIPVIYARLGRTWGFYDPINNLGIDEYLQRPYWASVWQLIMYYLMLPSALAGFFMLKRRKIPTIYFLAPIIVVTVATVVTYGTTRFRAAAEPSLIVLAAIAELGWSSRLAGTDQDNRRGAGRIKLLIKKVFRDLVGISHDTSPDYDHVSV